MILTKKIYFISCEKKTLILIKQGVYSLEKHGEPEIFRNFFIPGQNSGNFFFYKI